MDAWGLVVTAYSNGATAYLQQVEGSFLAVLRARHFVLTIRREHLTDQPVAHIEPRVNSLSKRLMAQTAWENFLEDGHSFGRNEHIGWPLYGEYAGEQPPERLVLGELDNQLRAEIMDYPHSYNFGRSASLPPTKMLATMARILEYRGRATVQGDCDRSGSSCRRRRASFWLAVPFHPYGRPYFV
jgi:hypothetical protein